MNTPPPPPLVRRLAAELVGTALLTAVVVGSGIQAETLSADGGVRFLANVGASALALVVLIELLGPVSGGHFNPLVSAAAWWNGPRSRAALPALGGYGLAQLAGAAAGAVLAQAMFERPLVQPAGQRREGAALLLGETVATAALLLAVCALVRSGRGRLVPAAVGLWIGAACWATSSGSFANPAVTAARALTDSYTGIAPGSVPGFVLAQCIGGAVGTALAALLFAPGTAGTTAGPAVAAAGPVGRPVAAEAAE
ncbi:aquaporin [Kitasatospora sp. NPDC054939]